MRPVKRGKCPLDSQNCRITFSEYGYARPHLIQRIGEACSYCERPLDSPDVEHVRAKDLNPLLEFTWDNFLLACTNCNSTKAEKVSSAGDVAACIWPDRDRTFDAFRYSEGGVVEIATHPDPLFVHRAKATAEMVGLFKRPGNGLTKDQIRRASDRRWEKRRDAWNAAIDARDDLMNQDSTVVRKRILCEARATGFWSVWATVFRQDPGIFNALLDHAHLPGTDANRIHPPIRRRMSARPRAQKVIAVLSRLKSVPAS